MDSNKKIFRRKLAKIRVVRTVMWISKILQKITLFVAVFALAFAACAIDSERESIKIVGMIALMGVTSGVFSFVMSRIFACAAEYVDRASRSLRLYKRLVYSRGFSRKSRTA